MTLGGAVAFAATQLRAAGVETPRLDAELLLCRVLGIERLALLRDRDDLLLPPQERQFNELVRRRQAREPLPYLLGRHPFLDFFLFTDPGVLIPRPETELLVETGSGFLHDRQQARPRVIDVGTGTGAIAIGLARQSPMAQIAAIDRSPIALAAARRNVDELGVSRQVALLPGSLLDPVDKTWRGAVDLIVSNPPYIPSSVIDTLQSEVALYEPREALDGGADGLAVIRELTSAAPGWLAPTGSLMIEIGEGQAAAVQELLSSAGFTGRRVVEDLAGIARVVIGTKPKT